MPVKSITDPQYQSAAGRTSGRERAVWLLVTGLFLLRGPFLGGARYLVGMDTPDWVLPAFEIGTYLLTAILIWVERESLSDYHVDGLALVIFVLGKPLELLFVRYQIPFRWPARSEWYWLYLPIVIGLLIGFVVARPRLVNVKQVPWRWMVVGAVAGIALGAFFGLLIRIRSHGLAQRLTFLLVTLLPVQQMMHAGISEEPFFRGFLWGALRRTGLKDGWILLLQGVLFWLSHLYYVDQAPLSFWLIVPLAGLVFGLLAWRSRSIASSMIAHGFANGVGQMVAFYHL